MRQQKNLFAYPDMSPQITHPALEDQGIWLPLNEIENAYLREEAGDGELLAAMYTDRIVFDHSEGSWYLWNGQHWEPDACNQVVGFVFHQVAAQYLIAASQVTIKSSDDSEKKFVDGLLSRARKLRYKNRIYNVLKLAEVAAFTLAHRDGVGQ